jgi:uncharacterized repeat protein (TIGR03803 family)
MKTQLSISDDGSRTFAMTKPVSGRQAVLTLVMHLLWAAAFALPAFGAQAGAAFASLHSFQFFPNGEKPAAALVQASDGSFYGTTAWGSTGGVQYGGFGTVFKISPNGGLTTLHSFTGSNDGANPVAGLVQGSDGIFYGTTRGGDVSNGTVFRISANGAYSSLYSFTGGNDGMSPVAGLVQGSDGNFFGTTPDGGARRAGTVFRLTIVPEPQLTIIPSEPYVILTWPTDYAGFSYAGYTLQSTTNLGSSAVWTTVSPGPVIISEQNVVISTISGTQRFYRLSSPYDGPSGSYGGGRGGH